MQGWVRNCEEIEKPLDFGCSIIHAYFIEDTLPIIVKAHSKLCEHKEAI